MPKIRSAKGHWVAQRLPFGHYDVGSILVRPRQRPRLIGSTTTMKQRAGLVGDFPQSSDLFQTAEEVGVLNQDARCLLVDRGGQFPPDR